MIVHTPTRRDYITVVKYFLRSGYRWNGGRDDILPRIWNRYGKDTCINAVTIGNEVLSLKKKLYYCYYDFYVNAVETIFDISDLYNKHYDILADMYDLK